MIISQQQILQLISFSHEYLDLINTLSQIIGDCSHNEKRKQITLVMNEIILQQDNGGRKLGGMEF